MRAEEWKGVVYVIIAGVCWGIIGVFTRYLSACGLNSVQITLVRNLTAAAGMLAVILATKPARLRIHLRDLWMFIGTGVLSIAFFNICYFMTIEMTTMSMAAILLYTAPGMVVVMSAIFFGEKITIQKCLALALAFFGCVCTTGLPDGEGSISALGLLVGLGSGLGYALYSIFGSVALKKYHTFTITFYTFLLAALSLVPVGRPAEIAAAVDGKALAACLLLGIVSTLVPFLFYTKGLQCMEAGKASVMAYMEPLVATLCGVFLYHESLTPQHVLGMALIFVSMVLLNCRDVFGSRHKKDERSCDHRR